MRASDALLSGVNAIGHGMAIWSPEGRLVACNVAFSRRIGKDQPSDLEGKTQLEFLKALLGNPNFIITGHREEWLTAELAAFEQAATSRYLFSDGATYQMERWPDEKGGSVSFLHDVTETIRKERALQRESERSAEADRVKSRFLQAANHDLRQPLAALKILIYNCIDTQSEPERQQLLHNMDVSVSIMEDLLGALLNIGQLDAGRVTPKVSTFQVSSILERMRIQFEHQAAEKGLELRIMPSKTAIYSDRALLERILSNFVGNAIRYTETGRVLVGCRRKGRNIRIQVLDTGPGIPDEHREDIFKEFFRISTRQSQRKHSLGLGLNISKRMADVLGHEIFLHSTPGRGASFAVEVPVGNVWHSDIGEPEISERIGGEFTGLTVLVMEDDDRLREALVALLERWGLNVVEIDQYDDLLPSVDALESPPDLIISDYRLQGKIQGTDLVNGINEAMAAACPAIIVTADTNPELIREIRRKGFPVLIKPVSPPSLRVTMHNILYEPELVPELTAVRHDR